MKERTVLIVVGITALVAVLYLLLRKRIAAATYISEFSGKGPYACPICGETSGYLGNVMTTFASIDDVNSHMLQWHCRMTPGGAGCRLLRPDIDWNHAYCYAGSRTEVRNVLMPIKNFLVAVQGWDGADLGSPAAGRSIYAADDLYLKVSRACCIWPFFGP